jgi:hypothetical protein
VKRSAAISVAVFFTLVILGLWRGDDARTLSRTSFGVIPLGHRALYDLLSELGLPVARSYALPRQLPARATVWWIEPERPCEEAKTESKPPPETWIGERRRLPELALDGQGLGDWIGAGGTAVVFLPPAAEVCAAGARLVGRSVPPRDAGPPELPGKPPAKSTPPESPVIVEGKLVSHPRTLELEGPFAFQSATGQSAASGGESPWEVWADIGGRPFVLWQRLGQGQLVVIADARFVRNDKLDSADAAPLVADLVRMFGVPWIDERAHGLVTSTGALAYLWASPAAPFLSGIVILALAYVWFHAATPARKVPELDPSAPSLEAFVDSLAACYAQTRDHARVFERFRELTSRRLRRHFRLPPEAPESQLVERLRRRFPSPPKALELFTSGASVRSASELEAAVEEIDRMVRKALK